MTQYEITVYHEVRESYFVDAEDATLAVLSMENGEVDPYDTVYLESHIESVVNVDTGEEEQEER